MTEAIEKHCYQRRNVNKSRYKLTCHATIVATLLISSWTGGTVTSAFSAMPFASVRQSNPQKGLIQMVTMTDWETAVVVSSGKTNIRSNERKRQSSGNRSSRGGSSRVLNGRNRDPVGSYSSSSTINRYKGNSFLDYPKIPESLASISSQLSPSTLVDEKGAAGRGRRVSLDGRVSAIKRNNDNNNDSSTNSAKNLRRKFATLSSVPSSSTSKRKQSRRRTRTSKSKTKITSTSTPAKNSMASKSSPTKSKTNTKRRTTTSRKKQSGSTYSRSSTMPGFLSVKEENQKENMLRFDYDNNKRKKNSEQMYAMSDSVPDSLIQFVDHIHKESRITPAEEITLGTKTQEAIQLQELYDNLEFKLNREPTDDEWCAAAGKFNMEALRQTIEEGVEAKNKLVTSNLRMVQRVVNLYIRNGLGSQYNAGDLMQDGTIALIRAAEKFEPQRGFRFSTYAMYWIRASVKRSQILQSRSIAVPQRLHETFKKYQIREKELTAELGRRPTIPELAQDMQLTEAQLERCVTAMNQRIYSLDAEINNPYKASTGKEEIRKNTMYELIVKQIDDVQENQTIDQLFMKEDLIKCLRSYLSPLEVDLLLLRFGLMDDALSSSIIPQQHRHLQEDKPIIFGKPMTIKELSRLAGMKPDKVRRLINNSLRRMRQFIGSEWEREVL